MIACAVNFGDVMSKNTSAPLLASADADLVGIASTGGNVDVDQVCRNNLGLLQLCGATDIPVSKSGSAAHFEAKVLAERLVDKIRGSDDEPSTYDGRVLCFLETGHGQASQLVFDFNKPPEPPDPNHFYHYEKLLFNKVYWYIVPRGIV